MRVLVQVHHRPACCHTPSGHRDAWFWQFMYRLTGENLSINARPSDECENHQRMGNGQGYNPKPAEMDSRAVSSQRKEEPAPIWRVTKQQANNEVYIPSVPSRVYNTFSSRTVKSARAQTHTHTHPVFIVQIFWWWDHQSLKPGTGWSCSPSSWVTDHAPIGCKYCIHTL